MDACEVSCTGENLSTFDEGTQSTNKNESRRRYGAVLSVMAGCHAYTNTRKDTHIKLANFAQELDTAG
jgi:hypothetical protein